MVAFGIETEERNPEAVLASGCSVATAGVAAGPHEDRHHVEPEAQGRLHRGLGDLDRHRERLAAELDRQRRGAVGQRIKRGTFALQERGVGHGDRGLLRDVARDAVGVGCLDHE